MVHVDNMLSRIISNQMLENSRKTIPLSPWRPQMAKFQIFWRWFPINPSDFNHVVPTSVHVYRSNCCRCSKFTKRIISQGYNKWLWNTLFIIRIQKSKFTRLGIKIWQKLRWRSIAWGFVQWWFRGTTVHFEVSHWFSSIFAQIYSRYEAIDLSSAAVSDSSKSLWMISPPELKKLINVLSERNEKPTVVLTLDYSVRRSEGRYETASGSIERPLDASEVQSLKGAL